MSLFHELYAMRVPVKYSFVSRTQDGSGPHWFIDDREVTEAEYEAHIASNTYRVDSIRQLLWGEKAMIWVPRIASGLFGGIAISLATDASDHVWTICYAFTSGLLFAVFLWTWRESSNESSNGVSK